MSTGCLSFCSSLQLALPGTCCRWLLCRALGHPGVSPESPSSALQSVLPLGCFQGFADSQGSCVHLTSHPSSTQQPPRHLPKAFPIPPMELCCSSFTSSCLHAVTMTLTSLGFVLLNNQTFMSRLYTVTTPGPRIKQAPRPEAAHGSVWGVRRVR